MFVEAPKQKKTTEVIERKPGENNGMEGNCMKTFWTIWRWSLCTTSKSENGHQNGLRFDRILLMVKKSKNTELEL